MPPLAAFQQFLYFEMTKKDILKQENEHSETIHLHKEGAFWKAYEYSAYIFVFAVMNCKPKKQVFREIDREMVHIGFPLTSLEKLKDKFSFVSKEDSSCTIKPLSFTPTLSFEEWKKSIALYTPQRKEKTQLKNENLNCSNENIVNKILAFNIESKTPMECMMFLIDLKNMLNDKIR